jgi:peroxiredoxin
MNRRTLVGCLFIAIAVFSSGAIAADDSVALTPVSSGAMEKLRYYMPQRLDLSPTKPDSITKAPKDLSNPLYGTLTFGPKESPTKYALIIDEPQGKDPVFYFDANANGDLTDDPAVKYDGSSGMVHEATITLQPKNLPATTLVFYRFDKNEGPRADFVHNVFYYRDYARIGQITLNGKSYTAALVDEAATGDYRGGQSQNGPGVSLLIDINGDGQYANRGERFDPSKPFKIDGIAYELKDLTAAGDFSIARSTAKDVEEIKAPPNLKIGEPALAFEMPTTDGKTVKFPGDYKGKIVMLDFWATWCGPCMGEVPNLAANYQKFHARGFDVLGISLDKPDSLAKVNEVTRASNMPWPQVYDGKFWESKIAQQYGIESIPAAILVDGDTGKIIATKESLRGEELQGTLDKALKGKVN